MNVRGQVLAVTRRTLKLDADLVRREAVRLYPEELAELDLLAFGTVRQRERKTERQAQNRHLRSLRAEVLPIREASLVASMGAPDAPVRGWSGVIGLEGQITGDGRVIAHQALEWAAFPLPLRWVASDVGGHKGAVVVGRVDAVHRADDGEIQAHGVIDGGSPEGIEVIRLMEAGFLSGISLDLDSIEAAPGQVRFMDHGRPTTKDATVTEGGRVRGATLVSIPAFDQARIHLDPVTGPSDPNNPDDCGCSPIEIIHAPATTPARSRS